MRSESRWARVGAVAVPAAVMSAIGLYRLGRDGMWRDEGVTFEVARRSVPEILRLLHGVDAVHGLYYLLMHAVLAVRADEVVLRLPSVAGAALAAGLVGALGTRLAGARAGCWAGLLYAGTPQVAHYAQEGRSYALVSAGVLAATLLLVRAADGHGSWWAYGVVLAVTWLLHELAALVVCAHAVSLACGRVRRGVWGRWSCAVGASLVVALPLALVSRAQSAQVAWLRSPGWGSVRRLARDSVPVPAGAVFWVCGALLVVAVCAGPRRLTAVALPLALMPPALLVSVSQWRPMYDDRYVLYALAGVPLLVAAGLSVTADALGAVLRGARRPGRASASLGVLALALVLAQALPPPRPIRADDLAALSRTAARHLRPGEPVLYLPALARRSALAYPAGFARARDVGLLESGAASGTLYGREVDAVELGRRLAGADRLWVVAEPYALRSRRPLPDPADRAKLALLEREFTVVDAGTEPGPVRKGAILRLYVRRPRIVAPPPAPAEPSVPSSLAKPPPAELSVPPPTEPPPAEPSLPSPAKPSPAKPSPAEPSQAEPSPPKPPPAPPVSLRSAPPGPPGPGPW